MGMTRQQALDAGFIVNIKTDPIKVDLTKGAYEGLLVNAPRDKVPSIVDQMESAIRDKAKDLDLKLEDFPYKMHDLLAQWRNWPEYKTGPVCGYMEYSAIFSIAEESPTLLIATPEEAKPKQ